MANFKAKVIDPVGLHARPASVTVAAASKFDSDIIIKAGGKEGNLKSIMNVMALGIKQGDSFEVVATGNDSDDAIKAIKKAMEDNKLI